MASFFERMQRATRIYETGAPSYLRTHPLTYERIADIQNRVREGGYRQVPDSLQFQLIRAKLKAQLDPPDEAIAFFESGLTERRFLSEAATHYGLARSLLRVKNYARAQKEVEATRKVTPASPIVETLACEVAQASGGPAAGLACFRNASKT